MRAAPAAPAVKVAPAIAALMAAAEPTSWTPERPRSASVRLPSVPLVGVSVTVSGSPSASATVKSASAAGVPTLTACAVPGRLPMVGARLSSTGVMVTVVMPSALSAPPVPCAPLLPSLKVQARVTLAGGVRLLLA